MITNIKYIFLIIQARIIPPITNTFYFCFNFLFRFNHQNVEQEKRKKEEEKHQRKPVMKSLVVHACM